MDDSDEIGFDAQRPIELWNQRLDIDGGGLFKAALNGALGYFTGNAPAAVSAGIDSIFAIKAKPLRPEEQAWLLIQRALARAMAKLAAEAREQETFQRKDVRTLVDGLDRDLTNTEIRIGTSFFDRPADHEVLAAVHPAFAKWLRSLDLSETETEKIVGRLGTYFTFSLHREWAMHGRDFSALDDTLKHWKDSPFAKADTRERDWMRNAAWLRRQVEEPLFEEKFGLAEVYIDLRAYWVERRKDAGRSDRIAGGIGAHEATRHVVDLKSEIRAWLDTPDKDDTVRVISGGPGSGKTSFAKMLAAELSADNDVRVLYVPLHQFEFAGNLRDAVRRFAIEDLYILHHDPLDPDEEPDRLVVFFDGLDELAMHGVSGQEAASDFASALDRALGTINHRHCRLQVILGGREIVVQASERVFRRDRQVLHVLPYFVPKRAEALGREVMWGEKFEDPNDLLTTDQRDLWWAAYGRASRRAYERLPDDLRRRELVEISGQPLLNYLLALSFDRGEITFGPDFNLNRLYEDLLNRVWERRWGGERQLPEVDRLDLSEFRQLMEEVGLAAWQSGTRGVSAGRIEEICRAAGLDAALRSFEKGAEKGALTLLAAFYFRQAERVQGERTFEFTHKSFGEYLTARRLDAAIEEIHADRAERGKPGHRRPWNQELVLQEWCRTTGPAPVDYDLLAFTRREVALRAADDGGAVDAWRQDLADLLSFELNHGLPMEALKLSTFAEMTRQARNAEEALLAAHFCCASVVKKASEIVWPSEIALRDLIARLDQGQPASIARACLSWLGAAGGNGLPRAHHVLPGARLAFANLSGADLMRAMLLKANLFSANLERAILDAANLEGANLNSANLRSVNLVGANLQEATLRGSDLQEANLAGSVLLETNLSGANLSGADLDGATLKAAKVEAAILMTANLQRANLRLANLARADLRGADLEGANVDGSTDFRQARMNRSLVEKLGLDAEALELDVVEDEPEAPEDPQPEVSKKPRGLPVNRFGPKAAPKTHRYERVWHAPPAVEADCPSG